MTTAELLTFGAWQYWEALYGALVRGEVGAPSPYALMLKRLDVGAQRAQAAKQYNAARLNAARVESVSGRTDALAPAGCFPRPPLPPGVHRYRVASGRLLGRFQTS